MARTTCKRETSWPYRDSNSDPSVAQPVLRPPGSSVHIHTIWATSTLHVPLTREAKACLYLVTWLSRTLHDLGTVSHPCSLDCSASHAINADASPCTIYCLPPCLIPLLFVPVGFSAGITDSQHHNQLLIMLKDIFLDACNFIVMKKNKFWARTKFLPPLTSKTTP
jgi:hypothetical protein